MKKVNLRELYPDAYKNDLFVDVDDEVYSVLRDTERNDIAYHRRKYRHRAQYTLNAGDGIESYALSPPPTPEELLEHHEMCEEILALVMSLPKIQARRIYAHFYLGMSNDEIAVLDGVDVSNVRAAIRRGLNALKKAKAIFK